MKKTKAEDWYDILIPLNHNRTLWKDLSRRMVEEASHFWSSQGENLELHFTVFADQSALVVATKWGVTRIHVIPKFGFFDDLLFESSECPGRMQ